MSTDAVSPDEQQLTDLIAALQVVPRGGGRFAAASPDWWGDRLFGGMVVAQALSAAMKSVPAPLVPHSMHGYFFRPVVPGGDSELVVEQLREGRSFATRQVTTLQNGTPAARMICSFHALEEGEEYQPSAPVGVPKPEELEIYTGLGFFQSCDAGPVRAADGSYLSSGRFWYRAAGDVPEDPGLHACVLAFMSDLTRTSFRPRSLGTWGGHTDASIDHAVWFHRPVRTDQWLLYDLHAVINVANRATVRGTMYTRDGQLVLTMVQELLVRPIPGGEKPAPWVTETP